MTPKSIIDNLKDNFAKIKKNLASPQVVSNYKQVPAWLPHPSPLLFNMMLDKVADPLDADGLWQYGGNLQGATKARAASLRAALQDHTTAIGRKVNGNSFNTITYKMFSDVVVWISDQLWEEQALGGYETLFVMAEKLQFLHANDFKGQLHQNRAPHYSIMPLASLMRDQVFCQFGLGVFIPGADDIQTGVLRMHTTNNQSHTLADWWFYEKAADHLPVEKISRQVGFYEQQYSLLIGSSIDDAAIHSPVWLEQGPGGYILVDSRTQPVNFKADGKLVEAGAATQLFDTSDCPFHAKNAPHDALSLRITPLGNSPDSLNSTTFVVNGIPQPLSGYTFVESDPEEAKIDHTLCLTALALPRSHALPGKSRFWIMAFGANGYPATSAAETLWQLRGDVHGNLAWKMAGQQVWQTMPLPTTADLPLPITGDTPLLLQPSPLPDSYLALYPFASPLILAGLTEAPCTVGRAADIALAYLARPDSLEYGTETETLNNLRFSREHLSIALKAGQLDITQLSATAPTYIQQSETAFQALTTNSTATLSPNDRVIVGCYVLHFQSLTTG